MAMTIDQARSIVRPQTEGNGPNPTPTPPPSSGGGNPLNDGGSTSGPPNWQRDPTTGIWYDANTGTPAPQWIQNQLNGQGGQTNPLAGLYPYDPNTGTYSNYPAESPIGSMGEGSPQVFVDPSTGVLYNNRGTALPQYLQRSLGGIGGGGGGGGGGTYGSSQAYLDQQLELERRQLGNREAQQEIENKLAWQNLLNSQKYNDFGMRMNLAGQFLNEQQAAEARRQNDLSLIGNRAASGRSLADFIRAYAGDLRAAEQDPFRLGEYLVNIQRQGGPNPLQGLIGEGVSIAPQLPDPYADPRFKNLLSSLYDYGTAPPVSSVPARTAADTTSPEALARVREAYDRDPVAAARFFSQRPEDLQRMFGAAGGAKMMLDKPVTVVDIDGNPLATAGENGPEMMDMEENGMRFEPQPGVSRKLKPGQTDAIAETTMMNMDRKMNGEQGGMMPSMMAMMGKMMSHMADMMGGDAMGMAGGGMVTLPDGQQIENPYFGRTGITSLARQFQRRNPYWGKTGITTRKLRGAAEGAKLTYPADPYSSEKSRASALAGAKSIGDYAEKHGGQVYRPVEPGQHAGGDRLSDLMARGGGAWNQAMATARANWAGPWGGGGGSSGGGGGGGEQGLGGMQAVGGLPRGGQPINTNRPYHDVPLGGQPRTATPATQTVLTPAQASAKALGATLRSLGYIAPEAIAFLEQGQAPPPGSWGTSFQLLQQRSPLLAQTALGVIQQFGNNLGEYSASYGQYDIPGFRVGSVRYA